MSGELDCARVKGLSYDEYQVEVIRLVRSYIYEDIKKYPIIKLYGYCAEDIETRVYQGLYNRSDSNSLCNFERYFIKASSLKEEGKTYGNDTKYLVCLIRRAVRNAINECCRICLRNRDHGFFVLNYEDVVFGELDQEEFRENLVDRCVGKKDDYTRIHYEDMLNQIPLFKYDYYVVLNGKKKRVTTRLFLDLLVSGYRVADISEFMFSCKTNEKIPRSYCSQIRDSVIRLARKHLKDYISE